MRDSHELLAPMTNLQNALDRARGGGPERHHAKSRDQGKLPVRERVERLVDPGSFIEDALLANWEQEGFGLTGWSRAWPASADARSP